MSNQKKDFDRYAYFVSKAKNYAVCYQPELKEVDMYGQQKEIQPPIRLEFHNGMKKLEKTKDNQKFIDFLRDRIDKEKQMDPRDKTLWEEKPSNMMSKEEHNRALKEKEKEIEELRKKVGEKGEKEEGENPLQAKQKSNK